MISVICRAALIDHVEARDSESDGTSYREHRHIFEAVASTLRQHISEMLGMYVATMVFIAKF